MSNLILPNRDQRRAYDKEADRDLPRAERIKRAKERNKKIAVVKMQGFAAKDWERSVKKYSSKRAMWIAKHIPPRKWVIKTSLVLNACPMTISGGMLHWALVRMQKAKKTPTIIKRIFAITVVLLSFPINVLACTSCMIRFPIRWILLDPIMKFQNYMVEFGLKFKIFEIEEIRTAKMEVYRFGKLMETFTYQL